ncbi:MAG: AsmA family protein, partial [Caulobacteraceae bacterium]|nr:AsmA family protein [Caulobacteraceae bacterium]
PSATVEGVRVGQPSWASGDMAKVDKIAVTLSLLPLFKGQAILDELQIEKPDVVLLRQADGQANWVFSADKPNKPTKLPAIRHLVIDQGTLRYNDDVKHIVFVGQVSSNETASGDDRGRFSLVGKGTLNKADFSAQVTGGPLLNVSPGRPYPFDAKVDAGDTHVLAKGQITKPFDLGRFTTSLDVSGPDMNQIYDLTGLAFPNTPPYHVAGQLSRDQYLYRVAGLTGRVGDSDINGALSVDTKARRPYLKADLTSRRLDFDDLASIFGGAPKSGAGETASATEKAIGAKMAAQRRLFPDATLQTDRIRSMDADVIYRAATINAPGLPLKKVSLTMALKDGVLTANPLTFSLPQGTIAGKIRLDASKATPVTNADLTVSGARIQDFVTLQSAGRPAIEGGLAGHVVVVGSGNSVHKAVSTADGTVIIAIPSGQMRQAFAELLGINAGRGLLLLLSNNPDGTPVRCAVAQFDVKGGVMQARQIVFDTGVVVANGSGTINLGSETMDLRLEGKSKQPRILRVMAPITLKGPLVAPKPGVDLSKAAAQGGVAAALGSLVSPLAAVVPFLTGGGAKDADCAGLLAKAS